MTLCFPEFSSIADWLITAICLFTNNFYYNTAFCYIILIKSYIGAFYMKFFSSLLILFTFFFLSGCALFDKIFGVDDELNTQSFAVESTATVTGVVNVPLAGASKISLKTGPVTKYKIQSGAKVYLIPGETPLIDCKPDPKFTSVLTNAIGQYTFSGLQAGSNYRIVIDLPPFDGIGDDLKTNVIAGANQEISGHFIRKLNTDANVIVQTSVDKSTYNFGETINMTVSGYVSSATDIHVEIWNEQSTGKYLWTSAAVNLGPGEFTNSWSKIIPSDWTSSKSSAGAEYVVYAVVNTDLKGSDSFFLTGTNEGDSTPPTAGSISINNGDASTTDGVVTLTIGATGSTQMLISNQADFSGSIWETYAASKSWTLTKKPGVSWTVYVKFADDNGNLTASYSDEIKYIFEVDLYDQGLAQVLNSDDEYTGMRNVDLAQITTLNGDSQSLFDLRGLEYLTSLTRLSLTDNSITDLSPLSNLTALTYLNVNNNQITDLSPLQNLVLLDSLEFNSNNVTSIAALLNMTLMEYLWMQNNHISDLSPLKNMAVINELGLTGNNVTSVADIKDLVSVDSLMLANNQLTDISLLQNLVNISWITLNNNSIVDISALQNMTNLRYVQLDNNQVTDLQPLDNNTGMGAGDQLFAANNPLSAASTGTYIPSLVGKGVTVDIVP